MASALFPKFVTPRSTLSNELRKAKGTSKLINSSAAFLFEVPVSNLPLVVQELQIGGTSLAAWNCRQYFQAPAKSGEMIRFRYVLHPG